MVERLISGVGGGIVLLCIGVAAGCGPSAAPSDVPASHDSADTSESPEIHLPDVPQSDVLTAGCDQSLGGSVEMTAISSYEAIPGYDAALAGLNLGALPSGIDLSTLNGLERALIAYMLETPPEDMGAILDRDITLEQGNMGQAVLGAFAMAASLGNPGLDLPFLRRGFHRYYQCARAFPLTLAGFQATVKHFIDAPYFDLESTVKGGVRRIWDDAEAKIYVAQTLTDGIVRETEILVGGTRKDGMLDFLVYDADGLLMDRSAFQAASGDDVTGASPYTCMACHFEAGTFAYTVVFPDM